MIRADLSGHSPGIDVCRRSEIQFFFVSLFFILSFFMLSSFI